MVRIRYVMRRRHLLGAAAAMALGVACGTRLGTQLETPAPLRRIGMLSSGTAVAADAAYAAFRDGLAADGFIEGVDYVLVPRFANGDAGLLLRFARELVDDGADVIVASTTGATQAARATTSLVPIVMVASHDPVEAGVVTSLAAPGGNVTGQSLSGGPLMSDQLEILQQITPVRRAAYLSPTFPSPARGYESVTDIFEHFFQRSASALGIAVVAPTLGSTDDIPSVLAKLESERLDAIYLIESPAWFVQGTRRPINEVVDFAVRHRLPSISAMRKYAEEGLLASYGDTRLGLVLHRGAAHYVAQILRGVAPGSLPIEGPKAFELIINAKTAAAIGRDLPQQLLNRAAFVIR